MRSDAEFESVWLAIYVSGDNGKSFYVALNDVRGADQDGIVTTSGEIPFR